MRMNPFIYYLLIFYYHSLKHKLEYLCLLDLLTGSIFLWLNHSRPSAWSPLSADSWSTTSDLSGKCHDSKSHPDTTDPKKPSFCVVTHKQTSLNHSFLLDKSSCDHEQTHENSVICLLGFLRWCRCSLHMRADSEVRWGRRVSDTWRSNMIRSYPCHFSHIKGGFSVNSGRHLNFFYLVMSLKIVLKGRNVLS